VWVANESKKDQGFSITRFDVSTIAWEIHYQKLNVWIRRALADFQGICALNKKGFVWSYLFWKTTLSSQCLTKTCGVVTSVKIHSFHAKTAIFDQGNIARFVYSLPHLRKELHAFPLVGPEQIATAIFLFAPLESV
jgi:hypothetical protein